MHDKDMSVANKAKYIGKELLIVAALSALIYTLMPVIVGLNIHINANNIFEVIAITLCLIFS